MDQQEPPQTVKCIFYATARFYNSLDLKAFLLQNNSSHLKIDSKCPRYDNLCYSMNVRLGSQQ